jgi:hypothetical protein
VLVDVLHQDSLSQFQSNLSLHLLLNGLKQQWFTHWPKLLTNLTHHLALNSNDSLTDKLNTSLGLKQQWFTHWPKLLTNLTHHLASVSESLLFKAKWCVKFVSNLGQWVNHCCLRPSDVLSLSVTWVSEWINLALNSNNSLTDPSYWQT